MKSVGCGSLVTRSLGTGLKNYMSLSLCSDSLTVALAGLNETCYADCKRIDEHVSAFEC